MAERILVVEDERLIRESLIERLAADGYEVTAAANGAQFREALEKGAPDLALMDVRLPDADGTELLKELTTDHPEIPAILMTAYSSVEKAVAAMKLGAWDYLNKPFDLDEMAVEVKKALEMTRLRREVHRLRTAARDRLGSQRIIAESPAMLEILDLVARVASSGSSTILIEGESGTGKDLLASAIHTGSPRAEKPFMTITCSAIPEHLLESELFGHERGAFTDAKQQKKGMAELAEGGTLFLDEIGDMPGGLQAKILRLLEDKSFKRVGGTQDIRVDVRIVAATNRDLTAMVAAKEFREDLYYRLKIIPIHLPPLRERPEDVPLLAQHFVERFAKEFRKGTISVEPAVVAALQAYPWPGNVRELRNAVERAMILGSAPSLRLADFPLEITKPSDGSPVRGGAFELPPEGVILDDLEKNLLMQALTRTRGNRTRAAKLLGLNRDSVRYRIDKYELDFPPPGLNESESDG